MTPSTEPDALTAAFQPLSKAFLSAKAKAQLRDSKGRFIKMNSLVRWRNEDQSYSYGKVTGTPEPGSKSVKVTRDGDNQVVELTPKQLEVVKALLPEAGAPAPVAKKSDNVGINYTPGAAADQPESPFQKVSLQSEVTADELDSLKKYTVNSYGPINKAYRGGTEAELSEKHQKVTADLDALIDKSIVNQDLKLYRGVTTDGWLDNELAPGSVLTDLGFTSSSLKSEVGNNFFKTVGGDGKALIEIDVPAGSRAANVSDVLNPDGNYDEFNEFEFIFPRGSRLEVTEDSVNADGQRVIRARLVEAEVPEAPGKAESDATAPEAPGLDADEVYLDSDGFVKVGNQQGSNPGGFYEDPDTGDQYYVKQAQDEEHALNEVLASRLYREAGIQVPDVFVSDIADKPAVASKVVADVKQLFDGKNDTSDQARLDKAKDGFAVDAWLANWDVVGLTYDNLLQTPDGEPIRIDTGGSLLYRAQGSSKGNLFGNEVGEVDSFRDPNLNPQSYAVFGKVTDDDIAKSVREHVLPVTPERIDALVDALPSDDEDFKQGLKDKLKARRQNLLERFNVSEAEAVEPEAAPKAPAAPLVKQQVRAADVQPGDNLGATPDATNRLVESVKSIAAGNGRRITFTNGSKLDFDAGTYLNRWVPEESNDDGTNAPAEADGPGAPGAPAGAPDLDGGPGDGDASAGVGSSLDEQVDLFSAELANLDANTPEIAELIAAFKSDQSASRIDAIEEAVVQFAVLQPNTKRSALLELMDDFRGGPDGDGWPFDLNNADGALEPDATPDVAAPEGTSKKAVADLKVGDVVRRTLIDGGTRDYEVTTPYTGNVLELTPLEPQGGLNPTPVPEKQVYGPNATLDVVDSPASLPEDVETPDATPVPSTGGEAVDLAPQVPNKKIYSVPVQHDGPEHVQVGAQVVSVKGDLAGTVVKLNPSAGYALVDDGNGKQLWRQWGTLTPPGGAPETPEAASDGATPVLAPQVPGKKIYSIPVQHDGPAHVQPGTQVVSSKDGLKGTITKVNAVDGYALVDNGEGKTYWRQWNTLNLDDTPAAELPPVDATEAPATPSELAEVVPSVAPLPEGVPEHVAIGKYVVSKKDGFAGVVLKHNLKVNEALVQRADGKKLWRRFNTLDAQPETEPDLTPDDQPELDQSTPDVEAPSVPESLGDVDAFDTEELADWEKELLGLDVPNAAAEPIAPKAPAHPITLNGTNGQKYSPQLANEERDALQAALIELGDESVDEYLDDFYADADDATLQALQNHVSEQLSEAGPGAPDLDALLDAFIKASTPNQESGELGQFVNALNQRFEFSELGATDLNDALAGQLENGDADSLEHLDDVLDNLSAELTPEQGQELFSLWDNLKTSKGWQLSAPEEPAIAAIDPATVLEDPSMLKGTPVPGSSYLLEDEKGRYFVNQLGHVLRKGTIVTSNKDGYSGEIIYLEKQVKYAKVKDANGNVKLRQLNTLAAQGVQAQTEADAPEAPEPNVAGKKQAEALQVGDVVLTPLGEQMTVAKVEDNVFDDGSVLVTYVGFDNYPVELVKTDELTLAAPTEAVPADAPLMQQKLKKYDQLPASKLEPGMKIGTYYTDSAMTVQQLETQPDGQVAVTFTFGPKAYVMSADEWFANVWAGDPDYIEASPVAPTSTPSGSKLVEYFKAGDVIKAQDGSWKQVIGVEDDPYNPGMNVVVKFLDSPHPHKYKADTKFEYVEGQLPPTWTVDDLVPGAKVYHDGKLQTVKSVVQTDEGDYSVIFNGSSHPKNLYAGSQLYGESVADGLNSALPKPELVPGKIVTLTLPDGNPVDLPPGAKVKTYGSQAFVIDAFNVKHYVSADGSLKPVNDVNNYVSYLNYGEDTDLSNPNPLGQLKPDLGSLLTNDSSIVSNLLKTVDGSYSNSATVRSALKKLYGGDHQGDTLTEDEWTALSVGPVSYGSTSGDQLNIAVRAEVMKLVKARTGTYSGEWKKRSNYSIGTEFLFSAPQRKAIASIGLSSADVELLNSKDFNPVAQPQVAARLNATVSDPDTARLIDELFGTNTAETLRQLVRGPGYTEGLSGSISPYAVAPAARPSAKVADGTSVRLGDYVSALKDNDSGRVVLVTPDGKFRVQRSDGSTFTRKATGFKRIVAEQATSISPAKAVFLKSRTEYSDAEWTEPIGETLSPSAALENIRTDVRSGIRGASIAVDDNQVEDLNVGISRVIGANGEELLELKFKLTPDAGNAWKKRVELEAWSKSNLRVRSRHTLSNDELPVLGNDYQSSSGKTYQRQTERGAEVLFHVADNTSINSSAPLSMHNLVQVYLPADASEADIKRALYDAGVDRPELATEDTSQAFIENRMLSILGGFGNPFKKPSGDERNQLLEQIDQEWGVTWDDFTFVSGTQNRVELRAPDELVARMLEHAKKTGYNNKPVKYLQHHVHGGDSDFLKMVRGPHQAALGAVARKTEGIVDNSNDHTGMSADEDVAHGSGQYIYASPVNELSGQANLIFPPEAMLKKFNFWANKYDNWGKRNPGEKPLDNFYVGAHELMTKHSIDLSEAYGYSVYSQAQKDKLIEQLNSSNITEINGKPLEEFIIVVDGYGTPQVSEPVGLPVDQAATSTGISL